MSSNGRSVGVLVYPGYQELEFWYPVLRAREAGATVAIIAPTAEPCESFLGYPVIGDVDPGTIEAGTLGALVVPGTVEGAPAASEAQRELIRAVHGAGRLVCSIGTGTALVTDVIGEAPAGGRAAAGPDDLSALMQTLLAAMTA